MGCFCIGARPQSPGAETVKALQVKAALSKDAVRHSADAEQQLIGTLVQVNAPAPAGSQRETQAAEQQPGGASCQEIEGEGSGASAAPLLAADGGVSPEGAEAADSKAAESQAAAESMGTEMAASSNIGGPDEASDQQPLDGTDESMADAQAEGSQQGSDAAAAAGTDEGLQGAEEQGPAEEGSSLQAAEMQLSGSARSSDEGSSSLQELSSPVDESSQAGLLGEVSLKHPRLSRLSRLFSCASSAASTARDSGERHAKQPQVGLPAAGPSVLDFDAAAAELVLLPRAKLLPLNQPEQALSDAAGMLGRQEASVLLTALLTLRRVAIHHHPLLGDSLEDITQLMLECVHGTDAAVSQAALMCLLDLFISYGNTMLRYCEHRVPPQYCCLLGLLLAASCGRTPAVRFWANEALRYMAERMQQLRVIRLLEPYLEHPQAPVRSKAAEWLLVATYRPPDAASRPASPTKWRA